MGNLSRIVLDRHGDPTMIVHPTFDRELNDPAFSPAGSVIIDAIRAEVTGLTSARALLVFLQEKLANSGRPFLASIAQARIDVLDAVSQWQADVASWSALVEQWPSPTQPQQTAINLARLRAVNSAQDVQDKRAALAALIAQIP